VEALDEGAQTRRERIETGVSGGVSRLFQLQHDEVVDPVRGDLVSLARTPGSERDRAQVCCTVLRPVAVEVVADDGVELGKGAGERGADLGSCRGVGTGLDDAQHRQVEGEQEAVRLDTAHDMDRLAVAGRQVDVILGRIAALVQAWIPLKRGPSAAPAVLLAARRGCRYGSKAPVPRAVPGLIVPKRPSDGNQVEKRARGRVAGWPAPPPSGTSIVQLAPAGL
jgi:hypothetical protein